MYEANHVYSVISIHRELLLSDVLAYYYPSIYTYLLIRSTLVLHRFLFSIHRPSLS